MPPELPKLLPFVRRAGVLLVGRERLVRSMSHLQFVWVTTDLSGRSLDEIRTRFAAYPVVQHATAADFEAWFDLRNTKVVGVRKSGLASSLYLCLKPYRLPPLSADRPSHTAGAESQPGRTPGDMPEPGGDAPA